jgi:long-chain fatty acid transport protein
LKLWFGCGGAFVAISSLAAQGAANPADTFGFGSRSTALGGAVSAGVSDSSANYYNPAGLGFADRTELTLGAVHLAPQLSVDGVPSHVPATNAWQLGLVVPGQVWGLPLAFGLGAQVAGSRIARVVTFTEDDQRWFLYEHRPEQLFLVSNIALRPTPELSVGAGLGFLASTDGLLKISGELVQPGPGTSEYDSQLQHEVLAKLSTVRYPNVGIDWRPQSDFDLALVYRGEGRVDLNVDSEITGNIHFGPLAFPTRYLLYSKTVQSWIPRQLTLGARYAPNPRLEVHTDLSWLDWSGLPSPVSATSSELQLDTKGVLFQAPVLPAATELRSAHARDRLSPRLGLELRSAADAAPWQLQLGYAYQPTALDEASTTNLMDADAHLLSAGGGLRLLKLGRSGALQLDVHAQWGQLAARKQLTPTETTIALTGHWVALGGQLRLLL